ncbi:hypothetical protein GCM10023318_52510 [Nocardia callitridis]|uniref:PE domain-containing protein n=1 Tax=Nocardia callitridis TaxID=648753 RepID=A0ABP9KWC5_9NOCA
MFQELVDTLGSPNYAVDPPAPPPAAPKPELPVGLSGFTTAAYSNSSDAMHTHSTLWRDTQSSAVDIAQHAATVGSQALEQIQNLVHQLQEFLDAAALNVPMQATYRSGPADDDLLASYAEYRVAATTDEYLAEAIEVFGRAQEDLGLDAESPLFPVIPLLPRDQIPKGPVPMPQRQRWPEAWALEV